ncbi:MAG: PIG-L family deacetylase [Burkholderiaceae bacterium]
MVIAPHPDDEVLACGGLLAMIAARGGAVLIVSITDGDASHPGSTLWPPQRLALRRHTESVEGLRRLGLAMQQHVRLGVPDGKVDQYRASIGDSLGVLLAHGDVVCSTWQLDGHPDHDATGEIAGRVSAAIGCRHLQFPIWMWHWATPGDRRVPWQELRRLSLTADATRRKELAINAHATQLTHQDTGAPPVLTAATLERLLRPSEYYFLAD